MGTRMEMWLRMRTLRHGHPLDRNHPAPIDALPARVVEGGWPRANCRDIGNVALKASSAVSVEGVDGEVLLVDGKLVENQSGSICLDEKERRKEKEEKEMGRVYQRAIKCSKSDGIPCWIAPGRAVVRPSLIPNEEGDERIVGRLAVRNWKTPRP